MTAQLLEIIALLTHCDTCGGSGKFSPECGACLTGQPERCTCRETPEEDCPQCDGTGQYWHSTKAKAIYLALPNAELKLERRCAEYHEQEALKLGHARAVLQRVAMIADQDHQQYDNGATGQIIDVGEIVAEYWKSQECSRCGDNLNGVGICEACLADKREELTP